MRAITFAQVVCEKLKPTDCSARNKYIWQYQKESNEYLVLRLMERALLTFIRSFSNKTELS